MSPLSEGVDALLEATVVGSFSRIGYNWRSRLDHWQPPVLLVAWPGAPCW